VTLTAAGLADRFGLHRRGGKRLVAGVAGGLADRLGVPDLYVRAAFVTLASVWGLGLIVYLAIWVLTLDRVGDSVVDMVDSRRRLGLAAGFLGGMLLLRSIGLWADDGATFVLAALSFGMASVLDRSESPSLARFMLPGGAEGPSRSRGVIGAMLLAGGLSLFFISVDAVAQFGIAVLAVLVTGLGLALAFGPWIWRMGKDLSRERRERIRQEERAEVAAHLHDSVLQTLALIQRTEDPRRMNTLARAQERELRDWLYGTAPTPGHDMISTALRAAAARVEADHHVAVELVTVGDAVLDERTRAMVAAATEALVNAARHSGTHQVSVYLEVAEQQVDLWVSDQGKGFEPDRVPADRRGIGHSIKERMERHGGQAVISSRPGEGTEVHLVLSGSDR
jgi:signal transduction histidine kinase